MKKFIINTLFLAFALCVAACSKESQIEGLIDTKPTTVEINTEIAKGTVKTIPIIISNTTVNLQINNSYTSNGVTELRYCLISINNGTFPVVTTNLSFINTAGIGTNLSSITYKNNSGYLVYSTNPISTTNYTYTNTNGIKYGNTYYIPLKLIMNGTTVYAYLQITTATDKLIVGKLVYNKVGQLVIE